MTLDEDAAVGEIQAEIEASFRRYAAFAGITSIVFYWAGAEVPPFFPSDVMGNVYAGKRLLADSVGGFSPFPLTLLEDGEDEAQVAQHLEKSLELAARAVIGAVRSEAFAALDIVRPFQILATPGHDEPKRVLFELP